jgi:ribonuclease-3
VLEAEREGRPAVGMPSNERLEFLGDAVVSLVVARLAFDRFPEHGEGGLTEVKTALVRRSTMAELAESLGLGDLVYMGRAEARGESRGRSTVLAEAMEAVVGALFLDQGFERVEQVLLGELSTRLEALLARSIGLNPKSRLQELAQARLRSMPHYTLLARRGPDHDSRFQVEARVGEHAAQGEGSSKQAAEQHAASILLGILEAADGSVDSPDEGGDR